MIDERVLRLELTPAPLEIVAAASDPPAEGEQPRRQVAGLAVPYEVEARVMGMLVTFAAGSVVPPAGRSPLLFGHDANRPVGLLSATEETPGGLRGTWSVDATPDGDVALIQAQSGSRSGLSVGVDLEEFEQDPDNPDRIRVTAAALAETSLVALAAYPAAGIDRVAAHRGKEPSMTDQPTPDPTPPADPPAPELEQRRPALIVADRPQAEMRLGEYVQTLIKAEKGDPQARERITAALDRGNVTTSPGVVPITYVQQIIDSLDAPRTLFDAVDHADMPASGMTIRRPAVTTRPDGNWLVDDTAGAPTGPVVIGDSDVPVRQWAWAGSASVALVERSSPSYIEEVFTQAVKSYYRDVEAEIASGFPAALGGPQTVGAAVGAYAAAYGAFPTLLFCGMDAYGKLLDATGILMFASGSADAQGAANYAGLRVVPSGHLAAADAWVAESEFQEVRESSPLRLSVSDVESLSLEIGVTAFYSRLQTQQALDGVNGAVGIPGFTPIGTATQATGRTK